MNETNILANVPVPEVTMGFTEMYITQIGLQQRLNQIPIDTTDYAHIAKKSIFWGHCINAEAEELREWLIKQLDPTWIKEMQMEAIDIVHFVFNIGIEAGFTAEDIEAFEADYEHNDWLIETQRVQAALAILNKCVVEFINLLPWKTWKTYKVKPDVEALASEYIDILRATLLLCNTCALSRQKIINMYFAKNKVNHARQDGGY